jgi:hypothetical protein
MFTVWREPPALARRTGPGGHPSARREGTRKPALPSMRLGTSTMPVPVA